MKSKRFVRVARQILLGTMLVLSPGATAVATVPAAATGPQPAAAPTGSGELAAESLMQETRAERTIPDTVHVAGLVVGPDGAPVEGANVFLVPGLEGDVTDADGRFTLATIGLEEQTLVVKAPGLSTVRRSVAPPTSGLEVQLGREAVEMARLSVVVGRDRPMGRTEAQMTSLDVVRTPGANADPFRALQSEPGVQAVDEGVGLHLQGGAVSEARVLLDGTTMVAPFRTSSATGLEFGSVDPFLLDEITLATAGFDVRVGDALSGVVRGKTRGLPERSGAAVTATAVGVSGRIDLATTEELGARVTGGFSDLAPLFAVHGREDEFLRAPRGEEGSLSLAWKPEQGTEVKLFALGRKDRFTSREEGRGIDSFRWKSDDHHVVLSGDRVFGPVSASMAAGVSGADRERTFGTFCLRENDRLLQARGDLAWSTAPGLTLRAGAVLEQRTTDLEGRVTGPAASTTSDSSDGGDVGEDAGATDFASQVRAVRRGGFLQAEWNPNAQLGLKGGLRADHSTLTDATTADPRVTALLRTWDGNETELELAWGRYHQVPEPLAADPTVGVADSEPMEATHWTAALRAPGPGPLNRLRARIYHKTYGSLVQEDRTHRYVADGEGTTIGAELRATAVTPGDVELQAALSVLDADRTDPGTGVVASSPFEASPSLTLLARRSWVGRGTEGFEVGLAYRFGRGRPFTPVVDARFEPASQMWVPEFGTPRSERLPDLRRLDLLATWLHPFWDENLTTVFLALTNVLNRENISEIRYNRDFSETIPVRSTFERTVFVGASTSLPF